MLNKGEFISVFLPGRDSRCCGFLGDPEAKSQGTAWPARLGEGERHIQALKSSKGGAGTGWEQTPGHGI